VGIAIIGDAIFRAVYAFTSEGPVSELCSLGGLSRCVDPALVRTASLFLGVAEVLAAIALIAAELPRGARCVVRLCGLLATFGGKGLFLLAVGSVIALSSQGLYDGPAGIGLAHVIIGAVAFTTGAVLIFLASPCVAMPSHPTQIHYHRVVALVEEAGASERDSHPAREMFRTCVHRPPTHPHPTHLGTLPALSPLQLLRCGLRRRSGAQRCPWWPALR